MDRNFVKGFITDIGGRTSHSAIMSRTLEIPAVVGSGNATSEISEGQMVIIDGFAIGTNILQRNFQSPAPSTLAA